jgi:hypothetical protein
MQYFHLRSAKTEALEAQVKRLNEFLAGFQLEPYAHQGYVRVFNEGDTKEFAWNKGGRLKGLPSYAVHDSLIVRAKDEAVAQDVLQEKYKRAFGISPKLTVNRPGSAVP